MLDRLRKRIEGLIGGEDPPEQPGPRAAPRPAQPPPAPPAGPAGERRPDARKRETRLLLSERIYNRASVLLNEVRTELLDDIHRRLATEVQTPTLQNLLEVTLDTAFTERLNVAIDTMVATLFDTLRAEFADEPEAAALLPSPTPFLEKLKAYRDEVLRRHLLEQLEVLALPETTEAFPSTNLDAPELKERIREYWASCREALEKFFRSVEMALLDGAREEIRLDSRLIRERLVAAQYRNGYRLLDERFRRIYSEVATIDDVGSPEQQQSRLDRRLVDEIIVPLAYFIRERTDREPREALFGRAELFREMVDKLVRSAEPLHQTAEALKPVLRKSIEQARPLVLEEYPYLRTIVESLKPSAIHRTTALFKVFETLVRPELDERSLAALEHVVRLDRQQYALFQLLEAKYPDTSADLGVLDNVDSDDARLLVELIEQEDQPEEFVRDALRNLGYLPWEQSSPATVARWIRQLAAMTLTPSEMPQWAALYRGAPIWDEERTRLANTLQARLGTDAIDDAWLRELLRAEPLPVDVERALEHMGYEASGGDRTSAFVDEVRRAIAVGEEPELATAVQRVDGLIRAIREERVAQGATGNDGAPYEVETWLSGDGMLVGLVVCREPGAGRRPIDVLRRSPGIDPKQTEEKLRRQLQSQALIYQRFYRLFSSDVLLDKERRREFPAFVKKLFEPLESNRHLMLSRFKYTRELVDLIEGLAGHMAASDEAARDDAAVVRQILAGLGKKLDELTQATEATREADKLSRALLEYERIRKYMNVIVGHAVNPWLRRQTVELPTEFEFRKEDVTRAVRAHVSQQGIEWERDVESFEAHGIRGTLGCRALLRFVDGSSKVVLLNYDRRHQSWLIRYLGPRITDVVRRALRQHSRKLPEEYDEKYEQPTFSLDEQSCRFFLLKQDVARVEATLVLNPRREDRLWEVVFLKFNNEVLIDRTA